MYKISICGRFKERGELLGGQSIKTKNIYFALCDKYGEKEINKLDTYLWERHPISFFKHCIKSIKNSQNIILLPSSNGIKVFIPLFIFLNKLYKRKIFYIVLGGWLPDFLSKRKRLLRKVKKLDKIFIETCKMKEKLLKIGVENVDVLVNFKRIKPLEDAELNFNYCEPYKLCTFSRVTPNKGIEEAIQGIIKINEEFNKIVYKLDIYGPIDEQYKAEFAEIMKSFPEYVQYKGIIESDKSVDILKNYYLLLFPTKYKTEGIPGTIIDALAAGIPIIASEWENAHDIIKDGKNGFIFEFNNFIDFYEKIKIALDSKVVYRMKKNCIKDAKKYTTDSAINVLCKEIME